MEYKLQIRDNCDRSIKLDQVQVLAYSRSRLDDVAPDARIVGEVVLSEKDKQVRDCATVILGKGKYPVREPGKTGRLANKTKGYVAVGDNEYLRIFRSRVPFLIWLLMMILVASLIALLVVTVFSVEPNPVKLSNPLPVIDPNAQLVETSEDEQRNDYPAGGGSVEINMRPTADLSLSTGKIQMGYTNPASSSHDAVIQLYVVTRDEDGCENEYLLAKSGRIPHGSKLEGMTLTADKGLFGGQGIYEAKYKVSFYNPVTGEKALMDSELTSITLKVYTE